jgi:hypothetical protein
MSPEALPGSRRQRIAESPTGIVKPGQPAAGREPVESWVADFGLAQVSDDGRQRLAMEGEVLGNVASHRAPSS